MPLLLKVILIFGAEMLLKLLRCHSSQHCLLQINEDVGYLCLQGKEVVSDVAPVPLFTAEVLYPRSRYLPSG